MPYLIETWDKPEHDAVRQANRPAHLAWLEENKTQLLACGAKMDDAGQRAQGSFYIVDVDERADAERFIAADPFTLVGLPDRVMITRWRLAFLDRRSCL
ncbi:YciI family protein [mine drainage metagenome]|uniref:YciI family protein n=1 Tax=mine drainage metagenome TaxID=410659 RepID=T1BWT6_9ZZZZ